MPSKLRSALPILAIAMAWAFSPTGVQANPIGGVAIQGQASFSTNGNNLLVTTQNGAGLNHSAINWQSFSIPTGSSTYFQQPNAASTSINRVVTSTPSLIFGTLGSNGNLVLVNQSGITVGAGAVVDTAGFTASALRMSDADALSGRLRFGDASASTGAVSVVGSVLARSGDVVLLGSSVDTGSSALVQAPNGSTVLAAGQQVEITGRGLEGIVMQVQAPTDSAVNLGTLKGDAVGIFAGTLKHSGLIQATTASLEGGKVVLKASGDTYVQDNSQTLATSAGGNGGQIEVLGNRVAVTDNALLDASGASGGGTVLVGGDYQGKNADVQNANVSYFGPNASIKADATVNGDGGKVVVWADDTTRAYGGIWARGGKLGGNGGIVENSGHRYLDFQGHVNTSAPLGLAGNLLLDPSDITIDNSALDIGLDTSLLGAQGILSSLISSNSTLRWATINAQSGGLTIQTNTASTLGSGNITVAASGTLSGPSSLTLLANNNISFDSGVAVTGGGKDFNFYAGWTGTGFSLNNTNGSILFGASSSLSTSGKVRFYTGYTVTQDATASLSAGSLGIDAVGTVSLAGINQVGTLAAKVTGSNNGFTYVGSNGITIGSITGTGVSSGLTTNGGDVTLTASSGNFQADSIVTKGATAVFSSGGNGGAVSITAANGNIAVGTVDTRGGNGADYIAGLPGGNGGNVSVTRSAGNLTLTGLSIDTSGGQGGTSTSSGGGAGGAAGSITLQASTNDLKLDGVGSLTANGGNGGNALVSASTAAGGSGGTSGAISLGSRGGANKLETVSQTISSTAGTGGSDNTGAVGGLGTGGTVNLLAGTSGVIQSGGSITASGNFSGNVSVIADGGAALSSINAYGLSINTASANGTVSQTSGSAFVLNNNVNISSGSGNVTLSNSGNRFGRVVVSSGGVVNLHDGGASLNVGAMSAGSIALDTVGDVIFGSGNLTTSSGAVNVTSGGLINLAPDGTTNITSSLGIKLQASGNLHLQTAALTTGAGGDVILASSGGLLQAQLFNGVGTVTLGSGGRWLTYLNSPLDAHTMGSFALTSSSAGFRQYGKALGDATALAQSSGNGNIYAITASTNPFTATLTGAVSKTYDGLSAVSLAGVALNNLSGTYRYTYDVGGNAVNGVGTVGPHAGSSLNVVAAAQTLVGVTDASYGYPVYGYTVTASGNVGTINAKTLTSTATITAFAKTYDGLLEAFGSSIAGSTSGALNGDTVALDTSGMFLDHSTAHAGATTISASGSAAIGTLVGGGVGNKDGTVGNAVAGQAGDYALTQPGITNQGVASSITARTLTSTATITAVAKTYDGMLTASTSTIAGSISGMVNGDAVALSTSGLILTNSTAHAGATTIAASGTAAMTGFVGGGVGAKNGNAGNEVAGSLSDYVLTQPTISSVAGTILAKPLTASASITPLAKAYDGTLAATGSTVNGSTSGVVGSDSFTLNTSGVSLNFSNAHVAATGKTISASGNVALGTLTSSGSGALDGSSTSNLVVSLPGDYVLAGQPSISSVSGTINAKVLSSTASILSVAKIYDGLLEASTSSISGLTIGALNGDTVALNTSGMFLDNSTAHAGATTISASGSATMGTLVGGGLGSKDGTSAGNAVAGQVGDYTLTQPTITNQGVAGSITARTLGSSATITAVAKTYDGMLAASTSTIAGSVSGTVNGDTVTLNTSGMFLDNNTAHAGVTSLTASGNAALGTFVGGGVGAKNGNAGNAVAGLMSDYTLTQPTVTNQGVAGSILAKQLTATATIGGVTSKVYDGTLAAPGATVSGSTTGAIGSDVVALDTSGLTLAYSNAHVATSGKTIAATGSVAKGTLSSSGSGAKDGSNSNNLVVSLPADYEMSVQPTISSVAGTITARPLSASASISGTLSKVYDGTTSASGAALSGTLGGALAGDALVLNFSPVSMAYNSADVATATAIVATGLPTFSINSTTAGSQFGDYSMAGPSIANVVASITPRAVSNWLSPVSGQWSTASNWDVMPSTGNVLAVHIPLGATAIFDDTAPSTSLQSVNSQGAVTMAGGSLSVSNAFTSANYSQSGGSVNGAGSFTVSNSFNQSAGSIAMAGAVSIRQASGNLAVNGGISGSSIALEAVNGAISQTAPLVTAGLLKVTAANSISLTSSSNAVSAFDASATAKGDVDLTNVGALNVLGVTVANGNLDIGNTGALLTSGAIAVHGGGVNLTTHSPLTIGNTVNADGSITLAALTPDSSSNISVNAAMASSSGGITVQAYNNFIQNAGLSAALAIDVAAGGVVTFGPNATSIGNPVSYAANGVPYVPPWIAATLSGGATDFVVSFMDKFQDALVAQQMVSDDPLGVKQRSKEGLVLEGNICKP